MISKQIGQSSEYYLMYEILRKLGQITKIAPYIGWNVGPVSITNTSLPIITGDDLLGSVLSSSTGNWIGSPTSFTYQWYRDGVPIVGETNNTYTTVEADTLADVVITVIVTAHKTGFTDVSAESVDFLVVEDPANLSARYYSADDSFISGSTPAVSGQGVQGINDQVGTVDCNWIGTITGKVEKINDTYYGDWKTPVATAIFTNITLSGEQTLNGVLTSASRVLAGEQSISSENGIYVSAAGAWTRATDADIATEVQNITVSVSGGTLQGNVYWQNNRNPITLGVTDITFEQLASTLTQYPRYYASDGGFVHIRNTDAKKFETLSISYAGEANIIHLVRLTGGTDNEYFYFVSNGASMRDRDAGTGNTTQIGSFNTLASLTTGGRVLLSKVYKLAMFTITRDGAGNAQLYVDGVAWGENIAVGSNVMSEHVFLGSNSHNANILGYKSLIYTGARDTVKEGQIRKFFEKRHGELDSYPQDYPVITFDPGGVYNDQETWDTGDKSINAPTSVFRSSLSFPEGASECRLYTSFSATQATALTQRTYVENSLQIKGVSARFGKYIRGTDYGTAPGTPTNVWYWMEFIAVDSQGNRQIVETQTHGIVDNQA